MLVLVSVWHDKELVDFIADAELKVIFCLLMIRRHIKRDPDEKAAFWNILSDGLHGNLVLEPEGHKVVH